MAAAGGGGSAKGTRWEMRSPESSPGLVTSWLILVGLGFPM